MVAEMVRYTDDGMGLDEAIAAYLAACEVEGKSARTVDAYAETLGMFQAICLQRGSPNTSPPSARPTSTPSSR